MSSYYSICGEDKMPPDYTATMVLVIGVVLLILASGCSTRMFKHELEYQGNKIVTKTLQDPAGRAAMVSFMAEYEQSERFKATIGKISDDRMDAWVDQTVGQGVMGGGLVGGGSALTALLYILKKKVLPTKEINRA